jgi:DNA-binding NarL/FixJ family response regulator
MLTRPFHVAIVDSHILFRKTLKKFLAEQTGINVPIEVSDIAELYNLMKLTIIEVLILDISVLRASGVRFIKDLKGEFSDLKILVLSTNNDLDIVSGTLDCEIHGYISKSEEPGELLRAIQSAGENNIYRNALLTEALYYNKEITRQARSSASITISERERKVIQMLWEEKSNKEIGDALFLGIRSVEKIRQDLKEKTGVKSTVGLLKFGIRNNLINTLQSSFSYK